jgi:hypothetical protein
MKTSRTPREVFSSWCPGDASAALERTRSSAGGEHGVQGGEAGLEIPVWVTADALEPPSASRAGRPRAACSFEVAAVLGDLRSSNGDVELRRESDEGHSSAEHGLLGDGAKVAGIEAAVGRRSNEELIPGHGATGVGEVW